MSADPPDFTDIRIKHLEMIQAVIARMSVNSGTIKRYAVVMPLSVYAGVYDYVADRGRDNFSGWVSTAAQQVARV